MRSVSNAIKRSWHNVLDMVSRRFGVTISIMNANMECLDFAAYDEAEFCQYIAKETRDACVRCDHRHASQALATEANVYTCHAGVCDGIISLRSAGSPSLYLMFGKFKDAERKISSHVMAENIAANDPLHRDEIMKAYNELPELSAQDVEDIKTMIPVLSAYLSTERLCDDANDTRADKIVRYMQTNADSELSVQQVCIKFGVSRRELYKIFHERLRITPHAFLQRERVYRAETLLREDIPLRQVARDAGFGNYSTFVRAFTNVTGSTPSHYRKSKKD